MVKTPKTPQGAKPADRKPAPKKSTTGPADPHAPRTRAERGLLAAVDGNGVFDASALAKPQRIVRSAFLRALLLGRITGKSVPETGLTAFGLIFAEPLDLSYASRDGQALPPLRLPHATFKQHARFDLAHVAMLNLDNAIAEAGISANGVIALSHLWLDGVSCKGGLGLREASIGGQLSLTGARLRGAVDGEGRIVGDALSADRATIKGGVFCNPAGDHRFEAEGAVRLLGTEIGGQLSLTGARLRGAVDGEGRIVGDALSVEGATIKDSVFCDHAGSHRFEAEGEVRFLGTEIGGQLSLRGAWLRGAVDGEGRIVGKALFADRATIKASVFCDHAGDHRFEAEGEVRFLGAEIGGQLSLKGAWLRGAVDGEGRIVGEALSVDGATIEGSVFCDLAGDHRFEAEGAVRLLGTEIGGQLSLTGARLRGAVDGEGRIVGDALSVEGATIKDSVFCDHAGSHRFEAEGEVRFLGTEIGGPLSLRGARLRGAVDGEGRIVGKALTGEKIRVVGPLFLDTKIEVEGPFSLFGARLNEVVLAGQFKVATVERTVIDLRDVEMGRLMLRGLTGRGQVCLEGTKADNVDPMSPEVWGEAPDGASGLELDLDGFTYRRAEFSSTSRSRTRKWARFLVHDPIAEDVLDLLDRSFRGAKPKREDYKPQPFEQAAKVLRESGHGRSADEVAVAKRELRRITGADGWFASLMSCVSLVFFRYGYGRFRATLWTIAFIAAGAFAVWLAQAHGVLVAAPVAGKAVKPCAEIPVAYALDAFLPLVDLGVEKRCEVNFGHPWAWTVEQLRVTYAVVGWLFIPMVALTFAGVLRKD